MSFGVPASATTPVGRFRIVAFWEGISYLLLLFVAMPLKYGLGIDIAVRVVGTAHGFLFLVYVVALGLAAPHLGVGRAILALVLSLIPCGTFWLEARFRRDEREGTAASPARHRLT
jgi:integral membrane protein